MRLLFSQLSLATAQRQPQFALQLFQVFQFLPHISELRLQAKAHRRTRLHPVSAQAQEAPNFAQFESQPLYAADKGQRFDVTFGVSTKASLRPGRLWQQSIALVKANRVNAQPACNRPTVHSKATTIATNALRMSSSERERFLVVQINLFLAEDSIDIYV
jgi:hypothetical protein